jgi:hypothetical protein
MTGKNKCKILKEIRRQIAEKNNINLVIEECMHRGECLGTCPRCEAEVRYLERELEKRRALGKKVAVAGLVATLTVSTTSCNIVDKVIDTSTAGIFPTEQSAELDGDIALPETNITTGLPISSETADAERNNLLAISLSHLLTLNEEEAKTYLSEYHCRQIQKDWTGCLIGGSIYADKFKLKLDRDEYYVVITYNDYGYGEVAYILKISSETERIEELSIAEFVNTTPHLSYIKNFNKTELMTAWAENYYSNQDNVYKFEYIIEELYYRIKIEFDENEKPIQATVNINDYTTTLGAPPAR